MAFTINKRNFNIKKGTPLVGGLKPDAVEVRKVTDKASGMTMAIQKGKFGNNGTC